MGSHQSARAITTTWLTPPESWPRSANSTSTRAPRHRRARGRPQRCTGPSTTDPWNARGLDASGLTLRSARDQLIEAFLLRLADHGHRARRVVFARSPRRTCSSVACGREPRACCSCAGGRTSTDQTVAGPTPTVAARWRSWPSVPPTGPRFGHADCPANGCHYEASGPRPAPPLAARGARRPRRDAGRPPRCHTAPAGRRRARTIGAAG